MINNYRTMVEKLLGPILGIFGFYINEKGLFQKCGESVVLRYDQKFLYVPNNGHDYFKMQNDHQIEVFNIKNREHVLVLLKYVTLEFDKKFRDEDDPWIEDTDGYLVPIVTLTKRNPIKEDKLPTNFNGVIYELVLRLDTPDKMVLGTGIDFDGNDIRAIIIATTMAIYNNTPVKLVKDLNFDKLFKLMDRVVTIKDKEYEQAKKNQVRTVSEAIATDVNLNDSLEDDSSPNSSEEDSDTDDFTSDSQSSIVLPESSIFDEMEL